MNINYCEEIRTKLDSNTGMQFNDIMQKCLSVLYGCKNLEYHATKQNGGDGGTDFYVVNTNEYFCFSSGQKYTLKDITNKIENDLTSLFISVFEKNQYTGNISKVTFIFGTHGQRLANDRKNQIGIIFDKFKTKYGHFDYEVLSCVDFCEKLSNEEEHIIQKIARLLDIDIYYPNVINEIRCLLNKIEDTQFCEVSFNRISTDNKLEKNNLLNKKEHIDELLTGEYYSCLHDVIVQEEYEQKFLRLKQEVVNIYLENINRLKGEKLLDYIIEDFSVKYDTSKKASELMVIYLFDHCDIFSD